MGQDGTLLASQLSQKLRQLVPSPLVGSALCSASDDEGRGKPRRAVSVVAVESPGGGRLDTGRGAKQNCGVMETETTAAAGNVAEVDGQTMADLERERARLRRHRARVRAGRKAGIASGRARRRRRDEARLARLTGGASREILADTVCKACGCRRDESGCGCNPHDA